MNLDNVADSVYNKHSDIWGDFVISSELKINDCTLREGEQTAAANFTIDEKLRIATMLEEAGIHQVQGGYPGRSRIDFDFIKKFRKHREKIKIEAIAQIFQPDWKEQIERSVECEPDILDLIYPSSDLRLQHVQKVSREQMLERAVKAVEFAKGLGAVVRFAPVDTTRTDLDFLMCIYRNVIEAGAEIITIADTAGACTPPGMNYLVKQTLTHFPVPLQVHCHNDFGLALANALVAVQAGASIIDVTINGLGERAGNVCLDELVIVLSLLYDLDIGIDISKLSQLAHHLEKLTKVPLPEYKPILGRAAFTHKLDAHVKGVLAYAPVYEVMPPEWVGNRRHIPIGKYSGPVVIRAKLDEFSIEASNDEINAIIEEVEKQAVDRHTSLNDKDFLSIVRQICGKG